MDKCSGDGEQVKKAQESGGETGSRLGEWSKWKLVEAGENTTVGFVVLGVAHRMSSGPVPGMAGGQLPHNRGPTAQSSGLSYGTRSHPDGLTPLWEGAIFAQCLTAFNELSHTNSSGMWYLRLC